MYFNFQDAMSQIDASRQFNAWVSRRATQVRVKLNRKVGDVLGSLFTWALSYSQVQHAIADTFDGQTPMCAVMRDAVSDALHDRRHSIEADDVRGLERLIEDTVNDALEHHVEDEHGKETTVSEDQVDEVRDAVIEDIVSRLRG